MTAAGPTSAAARPAAPHLSVVVPVLDEAECVAPLVAAVRGALGAAGDWELVVVDDGSRDDTAARVAREAAADVRVRLVRLARNYGQTLALQAGFDAARGAVVVSMDGDLQNDPADIPALLRTLDAGADVVVGWRVGRQDATLTRTLPSWAANFLVRRLTGIPVHDIGCTLKAYRRDVLDRIELYADQHRFIPVLAAASCAARITELPVRHHPRRHGRSKYGLGRVPRVAADLLVMRMIVGFHDRPLALFGMGAFAALALSLGVGAVLAAGLVAPAYAGYASTIVFPGLWLLLVSLAGHLLLFGVLGEVLARQWIPAGGRELAAREVTGGAA